MALWGGTANLDLPRRLGKLPLKIAYAALKSSAVNAIFGSVKIRSPRLIYIANSRHWLQKRLVMGFELFLIAGTRQRSCVAWNIGNE
jgi:hypothetical protein